MYSVRKLAKVYRFYMLLLVTRCVNGSHHNNTYISVLLVQLFRIIVRRPLGAHIIANPTMKKVIFVNDASNMHKTLTYVYVLT